MIRVGQFKGLRFQSAQVQGLFGRCEEAGWSQLGCVGAEGRQAIDGVGPFVGMSDRHRLRTRRLSETRQARLSTPPSRP